ncbi:MAG: DUF3784 domain-containing protein [Methanomassiliicoccaceae archaeon]|nr:DUF3784 domain-containing protein [Methanomassiliicoccaceae archaeon]
MMYRERWKGALAMGLLWTVATFVTYYFLLGDYMNGFGLWTILFVSLLLLVCGLAVYLGGVMLLAGFNTMTREERAQYNIKEVTSFMGIFLVLISYLALLMIIHFVFFTVFIAAVLVMVIYVNVSKRFRAST